MILYNNESGLMFQNVVVSTIKEMKIYLQSTSMVAAVVKVSVRNIVLRSQEIFTIDTSAVHIPPYATETFFINFSPKSTEASITTY